MPVPSKTQSKLPTVERDDTPDIPRAHPVSHKNPSSVGILVFAKIVYDVLREILKPWDKFPIE